MSRRASFPIVTFAAIVASLPSWAGEPLHSLGRHYGHGWSDGYHSRTACPPKRQITAMPVPTAQPVPWWMIPADQAEPLPHPASQEPTTSRYSPSSGPSLYRQPGEGSSPRATMRR